MSIAAARPIHGGANHTTLIDRVMTRSLATSIGLVFVGVLFVAVLAQVSIPLPYSPVPITGQTLGVLLVGAAYGANLGALTLLVYAVVGIIGVPVFTDLSGGLHTVASPTFGYILGFILAAFVIGKLSERHWDRTPLRAIAAFGLASAIPFLVGVPYLAGALTAAGTPVTMLQAIQLGFVPFIVPGLAKWALAAAALPSVHAIVSRVLGRRAAK